MWTVIGSFAIKGVKAAHTMGMISKDRAQRSEDKLRAGVDARQKRIQERLEKRKARESNGETEPGFFKNLFK